MTAFLDRTSTVEHDDAVGDGGDEVHASASLAAAPSQVDPQPGLSPGRAPLPVPGGHAWVMNRNEITEQIVVARLAKGLSWQELAEAIDRPLLWTTSALLGQHPIPAEQAKVLVEMLGLQPDVIPVLAAVPMRGGLLTAVPTDPTIYRFYEALQVYGGAIKEVIHEQFGDGIMSAINFSIDLQKKPHPSGDRVVVTLDGKFLPYQWTSAQD